MSSVHSGTKHDGLSTKDADDLVTILGGIGDVGQVTDSSGGTASGTIAAIGATYDQDEVRNAIASLAAKLNAIIDLVD